MWDGFGGGTTRSRLLFNLRRDDQLGHLAHSSVVKLGPSCLPVACLHGADLASEGSTLD